MSPHRIETEGILGAAVQSAHTLIMLRAAVVIDPDVARVADTHEGAGGVDTHGVLPAVVLPFCTLIDIFTVCVVVSERAEAVLAAAAGPSLQVDTVRVLHTAVALRTEVVTSADFAAPVGEGDLLGLWTVEFRTGASHDDPMHGPLPALGQLASARVIMHCFLISLHQLFFSEMAYRLALHAAGTLHVGRRGVRWALRGRAGDSLTLHRAVRACAVPAAICQ